MKRVVLLLALCAAQAHGQSSSADSLKSVLATRAGIERLPVLQSLANALEARAPREALTYAAEGLKLAEGAGDRERQAAFLSSTAFAYSQTGDFALAIEFANRAVALCRAIGNRDREARALSTLAIAYTYQGLYSKALQQNLEALRIREELHLEIPSLQSLNTIGTLYHHTGQFAKAIEYYQRVEASLAQRPDTMRLLILARLNIGFAEYRRGNYLVALAAAEKALPITRRAKNGTLAYAALIGGQAATDLRRYAQARQLLQLSHDEYTAQGQKHGLVQVHNALGRLELATGASARGIATLKESATLAVEIRARDELKSSYELLARAYERQGNTAEAYRYFRQFIAVRDSIYNSQENGRLADISMQIVTLQKDNEIRSLKQERVINALQLSNQRYLSAVLVLLVVSLASLMAIQLRHSRKRRQINEQLRAKNAELGRLNAELELRLHEIKHLSGLLPMCAWCKNIRDDDGYWQQVEEYLGKRTDAQFSHGICPSCAEKLALEG